VPSPPDPPAPTRAEPMPAHISLPGGGEASPEAAGQDHVGDDIGAGDIGVDALQGLELAADDASPTRCCFALCCKCPQINDNDVATPTPDPASAPLQSKQLPLTTPALANPPPTTSTTKMTTLQDATTITAATASLSLANDILRITMTTATGTHAELSCVCTARALLLARTPIYITQFVFARKLMSCDRPSQVTHCQPQYSNSLSLRPHTRYRGSRCQSQIHHM
jgi:hypothetical protein